MKKNEYGEPSGYFSAEMKKILKSGKKENTGMKKPVKKPTEKKK